MLWDLFLSYMRLDIRHLQLMRHAQYYLLLNKVEIFSVLSGISIIHNPDVFLLPIHPLLHPSQATASLLSSPHCTQLPIFCSTTCTLLFFNSQLFSSLSPVLSSLYFHSISCTQLLSYAVSLYPQLFLHSQLGQYLLFPCLSQLSLHRHC